MRGGGGGGEKSFTILLKKLLFLRGEKGFALIGVLVASAIGLIVISGLTQLFVNMGAQIKQLESRAGLRTFKSLIERSFQDSAACKANLEQFLGDPADASKAGLWNNAKKTTGAGTINFDKVRDKDGNIIEDLSSSSLESDYGLSGHVTLQLKCETPPCDCSRHPTGWSGGKCEKDWSVSLISQRKIKGVHIFNKPELLSKVKVSFKDKDDRTDWECKGLLLPPSIGCLTLKGSGDERSLVGCGSTQEVTTAGTTALGYNAGSKNLTGSGNTFIGVSAGQSSTAGYWNTFLGYEAGYSNTTGSFNTFVGVNSGYSNTTGKYNTFVGRTAGRYNTTGSRNTFVGYDAGRTNTKGERNTFVGPYAGYANTEGSSNTFVGHDAGKTNTTGQYNTFVGRVAGQANTTGSRNTFVGYDAGRTNTKGERNTFVGPYAGYANTEGSSNTFVGHDAGKTNTTGQYNTFVGRVAGYNVTTGDRNIIIGYNAGYYVTTGDNQLRIGNHGSTAWISGTIGQAALTVQGQSVQLTSSSRTLKKNIKPYNHFTDRLEDIIKTPLFTYEFKDKGRHPEKSRMGIIAEELPDRLKLKTKGEPPIPDWPSIYGTFWASIKALWDMIQNINLNIDRIEKVSIQTDIKIDRIEKDRIQKIEKELKELKESLKLLYKQREKDLIEIEKLKAELKKQNQRASLN